MALFLFLLYLGFNLTVLYRRLNAFVWIIGSTAYLLAATLLVGFDWFIGIPLWLIILSVGVLASFEPLRIKISHYLFDLVKTSVPRLSSTEEEALNAGDTWLEQDIFRGTPNWDRAFTSQTALSSEEQAFLDNEVQQLCDMLDEWQIIQDRDLSPSVWNFLKEKGFFGLVISKDYGGKGFSPRGHSDIVMKIASRSGVAGVTVMVPNSLGPGELIHYYGTEEQKAYYLPRLAQGLEIPCFALTEPGAGSDATSLHSEAIVIEKKIKGIPTLGLELNINKRWITLAPVATLIGLAVNLKDPNHLLKEGKEGITCVLVSRHTKRLEIGNRHLPGDQFFMNGTVRGKKIFVPITNIIGGVKNAGCGWQMLVECLSIGRSISLPALAAASSSIAYLTTGAFARIRKQFNEEIANFEGIGEKLAEIAGFNYLINATRLVTVGAVNQHKKPSVASAITKYFNTELGRMVINDAMDVHAGRAVVVGPRNYLTAFYQGVPISITVEGANIMSRNLLIFGQGSMACHPYIKEEFYAIKAQDKSAFHQVLWQHIGYFLQNFAKTLTSVWTFGWLIKVPKSPLKRQYQQLAQLSYIFAWLADLALIYLGGELKRRERLSARFADALSYLYMATGVLALCKQNNNNLSHQLHARWALTYCFYQTQEALFNISANFPSKTLGWIMLRVIFPFGRTIKYPDDGLDRNLAQLMITNNEYRNQIKQAIYLSGDNQQPVDRMEQALQLIIQQAPLYHQIKDLKRFKFAALKQKLMDKVSQNQLSVADMENILAVEKACWEAIQVDEFNFEDMKQLHFYAQTNTNPFD